MERFSLSVSQRQFRRGRWQSEVISEGTRLWPFRMHCLHWLLKGSCTFISHSAILDICFILMPYRFSFIHQESCTQHWARGDVIPSSIAFILCRPGRQSAYPHVIHFYMVLVLPNSQNFACQKIIILALVTKWCLLLSRANLCVLTKHQLYQRADCMQNSRTPDVAIYLLLGACLWELGVAGRAFRIILNLIMLVEAMNYVGLQ